MFEWTRLIHACKVCGASWEAPRDEPHDCLVERQGLALEQIHCWAVAAGWRRIEREAADGLNFKGKYRYLKGEPDNDDACSPTEGTQDGG